MYNKDNYFIQTKCVFKGCKMPKRKPDYVSNSGSTYWYGEDRKGEYVIRYSDHWSLLTNKQGKLIKSTLNCGSIASCFWKIKATIGYQTTGKAYFKDFSKNFMLFL